MRISFSDKMSKRLISLVLAVSLVLSFMCVIESLPVQAASDVKIVHAKTGEKGGRNNKPGDQTGKEVTVDDWSYSIIGLNSRHWQYVFRAKDPEVGRRIAQLMVDAANNDHIGYDQNAKERETLYKQAEKHNWDMTAIDKDCETICSCIISVCLTAVGIPMPKTWYPKDMRADLEATGLFYCFSTKDYLTSSSKLVVGDILLSESAKHTVVVAESPHPFTYPVTYTTPEGKSQTAWIAEQSDITLNLNNGNGIDSVKADREFTLEDAVAAPEKEGFEFTGWKKTASAAFSAVYKQKWSAIKVTADPVPID